MQRIGTWREERRRVRVRLVEILGDSSRFGDGTFRGWVIANGKGIDRATICLLRRRCGPDFEAQGLDVRIFDPFGLVWYALIV